jgi:serine protease Do
VPFDFDDSPEGSPFERFFREFQDRIPEMQLRPRTSQGSGFLISGDGYIVTNNHVVDGASEFTVAMNDGSEYQATLVGVDDRTDLALLKIEDGNRDFTYVRFSDEQTRIGDWVVAVGNPFGLGGTVTAGIVSANGRQIGSGPYDDYIQIDAAVNQGNSGGPAFNLNGEVIGVNTAIFSPSGGSVGIAFAIPSATAEAVVNDLMDDGQVVRGWLGVQIQDVTGEIASGLGLNEAGGALVIEPQPGGPAEAAGLVQGDAILALNGEPIEGTRDLATQVAALDPGTEVTLSIWRDGSRRDLGVTLGTLPESGDQEPTRQPAPRLSAPTGVEEFGLGLGPSESGDGVAVAQLDPEGEAAQSGLQVGDVILSVAGTPVTSPAEAAEQIAAARERGLEAVLLRVQSGDATRFVALSFEQG